MSKKLKVCHITSVHGRYDIRIFVKECMTLALCDDYTVSLIVADGLKDELIDGINIYDVGVEKSRYRRMLITPQKIFKKIMQLRPQVIHFHDPELMTLGKKLLSFGFKVIYDVHEDVPKQVLDKRWLPQFIRPLISKIMRREEQNLARQLSAIVCATDTIAKRFRKYNKRTIALLNYPVLGELNRIDIAWELRKDYLCYIGSISQTRGIVPLIESLAQSKIPLQLAGKYSDAEIELMIPELKGFQYVNYLGVLSREKIVALLSEVRVGIVTLLPTLSYVEALPIKLFEYMLAGIPVIASDFPILRDIVERHHCGILVDPTDSQAIANACMYLLANPKEAMAMGANGKKAVLANYTWEQEEKKLLNLYAML